MVIVFSFQAQHKNESKVLRCYGNTCYHCKGTEFRDIMAELNSGLRYAFNLSPSSDKRGNNTWAGDDDYVVVVVSGSGTAGMEMVVANRFRRNDRVLVPTNGKFGERVAEMCDRY